LHDRPGTKMPLRASPPDDPHELVRWCLEGVTRDGRLAPTRQNFRRAYLWKRLDLATARQLTDDEADLLVSVAFNDPEVWDDAVSFFRYHVDTEGLVPPAPLLRFASRALDEGRPKRRGRHKGDDAQRNGYLRLAAQHLASLGLPLERSPTNPEPSVCSVISDVLNELKISSTPAGVRKMLQTEPDPFERALTWLQLEQLKRELIADLARKESG